jgi:hypothetical protein
MGTFLKFHQGDAGVKGMNLATQCGETCFQLNEAPFFFLVEKRKQKKNETEGGLGNLSLATRLLIN